MPVKTETEEARERVTGNGQQHREATREQVREGQDRFAELQESYQQQARQHADEVKWQLQEANSTVREGVGQYVRAVTRGYQAFLPQAVVDPREAIDFAADFVVQAAELQRSILHELVTAGQVNARAATRAAESLSDR